MIDSEKLKTGEKSKQENEEGKSMNHRKKRTGYRCTITEILMYKT
jgi:hypothetical protein